MKREIEEDNLAAEAHLVSFYEAYADHLFLSTCPTHALRLDHESLTACTAGMRRV